MLPDAEVHVAAAGRAGFEIAGTFECEMSLGRRCEIGRTADQPRIVHGNGVEHLAGGVARRKALCVGRKSRKRGVPTIRKVSALHAFDPLGKVRVFFSIGLEQSAPVFLEAPSAPADAVLEMLAYAVRYQKFDFFGPAVATLGETYLFLAERFAMGRAGVVLVRGAIADMAFDDDQGRYIIGSLEDI